MNRSAKLVALCTVALAAAPVPASAAASTCLGKPATITGGPGDDTIHGTPGNDVIVGRRGKDEIHGHGGRDLICGGPGGYLDRDENTVEYQYLLGGSGNDILKGGPSYDWLEGDTSSDTLRGGAYRDVLNGGPGRDRLKEGRGRGELRGEGGNDRISGGRGEDSLYGNDAGNDVIVGGPGRDYLSTHLSGPFVKVNLATGRARATLSGHDEVAEIEDVGGSTNARNVFIGNGRDNELLIPTWQDEWRKRNVLVGGGGNDLLTTGFGDDILRGGPGKDVLQDPGGNDRDVGGLGRDTLDYTSDANRRVRADLRAGRASQGSESDRLIGLEHLKGTFHDDVLKGDAGRNRILGDSGDDVIEGRAGSDYLVGSNQKDRVNGGPGDDRCFSAEVIISC